MTASIEDASTIAKLIRTSFADKAVQFNLTPENAPTHPSNCQTEWIESTFKKDIAFYLFAENHVPTGCVALEQANPEVCYLERLGVIPEHRRKGLGRELVAHVIAQSRKLGAKQIEIGIIKQDLELKNWYLKLGFKEKNTAQFKHLPFDVLFMYFELE